MRACVQEVCAHSGALPILVSPQYFAGMLGDGWLRWWIADEPKVDLPCTGHPGQSSKNRLDPDAQVRLLGGAVPTTVDARYA